MFRNFIYSMSLSLFLLLGCTENSDYVLLQSTTKAVHSVQTVETSYEYIILPQDRLKISIYRNPELLDRNEIGQDMQRNGVLVDTKGMVYLPLVGGIKLAGLTQTEASQRITREYKKYLKIPMVYIEVLNKRLYVIGEVAKAGPITLDREKMTILEAISYAGDLTDAAVRNNIIVLSYRGKKKAIMRSIDLTNFDTLTMSSILLYPNDVVYVQPNGWKEFKVNSDNFTAPFKTIAEIASPFVQLHYLTD
ncbi:MAG: polysaccharide biosynthesis/export family protein [Sulfurovum sp.]|nr:polysaccharide biosynthesis/export family protein [Sulfurovum sp.]